MSDIVKKYIEFLNSSGQEGYTTWMYPDTMGHPTIGYGHEIKSSTEAQGFPFTHGDKGKPANRSEIAKAYQIINKIGKNNLKATAFKNKTNLRLSDVFLVSLRERDVNDFVIYLQSHFQNFNNFPEPAQIAIIDIAFQNGKSGLTANFPGLKKAIAAEDWAKAASLLPIAKDSKYASRNKLRRKYFMYAAEGNGETEENQV